MGSGNNFSAIGLTKFSVTKKDKWGYCPGKENPADISSRGERASGLIECDNYGGEVPVGYPDQKMSGQIQRLVKPLRGTKRENKLT